MEDLLAVIAERVGVRPGDDSSISTQRDQSDEKSAIFAKEKSEGVVGPSTSSMLATGWLPTSIDEARSELIHVLNILPDTATVRRMCKFFFEEVDHMHYSKSCLLLWLGPSPAYSLPTCSFLKKKSLRMKLGMHCFENMNKCD